MASPFGFRVANVQKRLQDLECTSYNGVMVCKIDHYMQKKADAIARNVKLWESSPFYTDKRGYKMRLQVYLNGEGVSEGKYLTLKFGLMKGKFDDLLLFPFKQEVTLRLLAPHQSELDIVKSFQPDQGSVCFRKPREEMNIPWALPQFATHEDVESDTFLVHNCIYVKADVEINDNARPPQ